MRKMLGKAMGAMRGFGLMMLAWLPLPWLLVAWETWGGASLSAPVTALAVISVLATLLALWMMVLLLRDGRGNPVALTVTGAAPHRWAGGCRLLYAAPYAALLAVGLLGAFLTGRDPAGPLDPWIGLVALLVSLLVMAASSSIAGFVALNPALMLFGYRAWDVDATFTGVGRGRPKRTKVTLMARTAPKPGARILTGADLPWAGPDGRMVRYALG